MGIKNRNGKPTKFQLDALKALKADMKGIRTYRDAENALKRLRKAKARKVVPAAKKAASKNVKGKARPKKAPVAKTAVCSLKKALAKKDAADKAISVKAANPTGKSITVKKAINGTDEVRIKLPSANVARNDDSMGLSVEVYVFHDNGLFTKKQLDKINVLATFCHDEILRMCEDFAAYNGLAEVNPNCSCGKSKAKKPCCCKKAKTSKK